MNLHFLKFEYLRPENIMTFYQRWKWYSGLRHVQKQSAHIQVEKVDFCLIYTIKKAFYGSDPCLYYFNPIYFAGGGGGC